MIIYIIANITGILYTLKRIFRAIIENFRAEISFAANSVKVFLTTYKSSGLKYHFQSAFNALMIFSPWGALQCFHLKQDNIYLRNYNSLFI